MGHNLHSEGITTFAANPGFFAATLRARSISLVKEMAMDALSEALSSVRMTGAIFVDATCTAPWGFAVPPMERIAHILAPGTERVVGYHLVTEGKGLIGLEGEEEVPLAAGDIVIVPHGDAHTITNGSPSELIDTGASVGRWLAGDLSPLQAGGGGGGEVTRFVCGYFGCERHAARLFLAGLAPIIKMNVRGDPAGAWLENSIQHLLHEARSGRPGRAVLLSKMAEALFIETLRRHMEQLPPEQTGWLAGARDPVTFLRSCTGSHAIPGPLPNSRQPLALRVR
jgi:hypothetical protein